MEPKTRVKAAVVKKESLASAAAAARRELGLASIAPVAKVTKSAAIAAPSGMGGCDDLASHQAARAAPAPVGGMDPETHVTQIRCLETQSPTLIKVCRKLLLHPRLCFLMLDEL